MNTAQQNAVGIIKAQWVFDPFVYDLAIQVLEDALKYYGLSEENVTKTHAAIIELNKLRVYALENYEGGSRLPRPELPGDR